MQLVIDTALDACTVALVENGVCLYVRHDVMGRGQADRLVPMVADVLTEAGSPAIGTIAVSVGPGSFTGIRVGIAAAKAFGLAWDVPVIGVSTMDALAAAVEAVHPGPLVVVHDAKRAHVYVQCFVDGAAIDAPAVLTPEQAADRIRAHGPAVGTGVALLPPVPVLDITPFPLPLFMAVCAARQPRDTTPLYVRAPDAVPRYAA